MLRVFLYKRSNQYQEVPRNVVRAKIDSSIKAIREEAFHRCSQLAKVSEGLEEIEE